MTLPRTETHELTADDGTVYRLWVSLPRKAEARTERFGTLYVLDADYAFAVVRNVTEHLSDRHDLPELITVGIGYPEGIEGDEWLVRYRTQRTRDYTPTRSPIGYPGGVQDVSGGAARFLDFIEKQVVPFVEAHYRTSGERGLIGHSYGGLFASWAALTRPLLFSRVIAISPSLWYDKRFVFRTLDERRASSTPLPSHLFLGAGSAENVKGEGDIAGDVAVFAEQLRGLDAPGAVIESQIFENETHNSVFPAAVTRGLRRVFSK